MAERAQVIPADRLRITAQFRVRGGMAYELLQHGRRLTLLFSHDPTSEGEWSCEAFIGIRGSAGPVMRVGKTRTEALQRTSAELGDAARFDWDAIVQALTQVRAL